MVKVFICFLFVAVFLSGGASAHSFSGEWVWNNSPAARTFSIEIKQQGGELQGQYCAVAQNGSRVDCDDEVNQNIGGNVDSNGVSATVRFSSFFGAKNGEARIEVNGDHLHWHIIKNPDGGEFYSPRDAVLDRR